MHDDEPDELEDADEADAVDADGDQAHMLLQPEQ